MNRKKFLSSFALLAAGTRLAQAMPFVTHTHGKPTLTLLRHACIILSVDGHTFLIDPMLAAKETLDPVPNAGNANRVPMMDLPIDETELTALINKTDAVFITHTHRDHWDEKAQEIIPKNKQIFCQPGDEPAIQSQGFTNVATFDNKLYNNIMLHRVGGQHGTGDIGAAMGKVSGIIISTKNTCIYIAGDTIWCQEVKDAIDKYQPSVIVLNAGEARFTTGDPITMTKEDVYTVTRYAPNAHIIAVHMDTINHCRLSRTELRQYVIDKGIQKNVSIPDNGEQLKLI